MASQKKEDQAALNSNLGPPVARRAHIYELTYSAAAAKAGHILRGKLLVKDASNPSASPDGRWVAYTGWLTITTNGKAVAAGTAGAKERYGLCLLDRKTGSKHWLRPNTYDFVKWSPNNKELLLIERQKFFKLALNQLLEESKFPDLIAEKIKPLADLSGPVAIDIQPKGFSQSEQYFFFKASQIVNSQDQLYRRSLRAIDLANGEVKTVFEWTKDQNILEDFDWLDESRPSERTEREEQEK